jgi:hypothetical protein
VKYQTRRSAGRILYGNSGEQSIEQSLDAALDGTG